MHRTCARVYYSLISGVRTPFSCQELLISFVVSTIENIGVYTGQGGREGSRPPWIWETSKIRADGMGNSGIQGTEFFYMKVLAIWICKFKLINCKKIAPKMNQNSPFWAQKSKNFLAQPPPQTSLPWGGGHPSPHPTPLSAFGASILAPTALDLGLRGDCLKFGQVWSCPPNEPWPVRLWSKRHIKWV